MKKFVAKNLGIERMNYAITGEINVDMRDIVGPD
jgi:hypothetical protein